MWIVVTGILLGWALGANNAANIFGPAVTSNALKFRHAAIVSAIFIILGAMLQGHAGIETMGKLTGQTMQQAFICMLAAGIVSTIMTILKLPISTSQAVIGAIIGAGFIGSGIHWKSFSKVVICWIGTPIGAALIAYLFQYLFVKYFRRLHLNIFNRDLIIGNGLILCTIYGAYALGANNVANATGIFVKANILTPFWALLIGSLSISFGVLTFSRRVIETVGKSVVPLNGFSALIVLFSSALTVHFYAMVGVPVSSSQAIVGAVLGVGILKGFNVINLKVLSKIAFGWIMTPVLSFLIAIVLILLIKL